MPSYFCKTTNEACYYRHRETGKFHLTSLIIIFFIGQLHTFPQGKVHQEDEPIRRLKWGTASLIARAPVTPIVLPIIHNGLQKVILYFFFFFVG